MEAFADDEPILPPPDRVLHGGASILQSQAACGFRAFAEKRLFSCALDTVSLGLDPRERGSLVHAVLERFWAEVETQAALKSLPLDERNALLSRFIDAAFAKDHAHPASGWPRAYLRTERRRLLKLLGLWLDYEANQRAPFTVQSREETLRDVQIGPLRLNIRVDRVDCVQIADDPVSDPEDGKQVSKQLSEEDRIGEIILDYKTGPASPADWLGDRPDAPQLPLYAVVSHAPHLAAVAFASVRPGNDLGLHGYAAEDGVLPKAAKLKAESLAAQVAEWREVAHRARRGLPLRPGARLDPSSTRRHARTASSGCSAASTPPRSTPTRWTKIPTTHRPAPPIPQARRTPVAELLRFPPA